MAATSGAGHDTAHIATRCGDRAKKKLRAPLQTHRINPHPPRSNTVVPTQMDFSTSLTLRTTLKFLLLLVLAPPLQAGFIHPGLLHSQSDLDRMRLAVARQQQPIYAGFEVLVDSPHSKSDYRRKGPFPEFGRAPNIHTAETQSDAKAAYENALMWAVTGDRTHAEKSIEITNAWVGSLERVTGIDGVLAAGLQGFKFANAAEILRHTDSGWPEHDAQRCADWLKNAWLPTIEHYAYFANGNWETAALQTKMAIAVYCDDRILFEEVVRYAVDGAGNGSIPHMVVYPTGQSQETTRAQPLRPTRPRATRGHRRNRLEPGRRPLRLGR